MRKVYISNEIACDSRLVRVARTNPVAALIWPWMLTALDDWGRGETDVIELKISVFPSISCVDDESIETSLQLFSEHGLLKLYEVEGVRYMSVPREKWFKYQTHIHSSKREDDSKSRYPAPPSENWNPSYIEPAESRALPRIPARSRGNGEGEGQKGRRVEGVSIKAPAPEKPATPSKFDLDSAIEECNEEWRPIVRTICEAIDLGVGKATFEAIVDRMDKHRDSDILALTADAEEWHHNQGHKLTLKGWLSKIDRCADWTQYQRSSSNGNRTSERTEPYVFDRAAEEEKLARAEAAAKIEWRLPG